MNFSCPNCGHPVPETIKSIVMLTCPACDTTLYLQGNALLNAGHSGEMHDAPELFGLGCVVKLGRKAWEVLGHARFSYGRGWWDEYWCEDPKGRGAWVSVDEGDVVVQLDLPPRTEAPSFRPERPVGHYFTWDTERFTLVEKGEGVCEAVRGQFGERLRVGDRFAYANAQGESGRFLSCEADGSGVSYFLGEWHDPFEIALTRSGVA